MPTKAKRLFIVVALTGALLASPAGAGGADENVATARSLLIAFTDAVIAGPEAVAPLLAPEHQIMRSNGVGYGQAGYVSRGAGSVNAQPNYSHDDLVVTTGGDTLGVRYFLQIDETIDGKAVARRAPRLAVFRKIDGAWKVTAHANFARSE